MSLRLSSCILKPHAEVPRRGAKPSTSTRASRPSLMTIYKSKGLEYHTVMFVGLDDGAWFAFQSQTREEMCGFFVRSREPNNASIFLIAPRAASVWRSLRYTPCLKARASRRSRISSATRGAGRIHPAYRARALQTTLPDPHRRYSGHRNFHERIVGEAHRHRTVTAWSRARRSVPNAFSISVGVTASNVAR